MRLKPRDKWVLWLFVGLVSAWFIYDYGISAVVSYASQIASDRDKFEKQLLHRYELIQKKKDYQSMVNSLEKVRNDARACFLPTDDPNAASAELLKFITALAEGGGIPVTRIDNSIKPDPFPREQIEKCRLLENYLIIHLNVYVRTTPDKLALLVSQIEGEKRLIFLDRLEIKQYGINTVDKNVNGTLYLSTYIYRMLEKKPDPSAEKKK